MSQRSTAPPSSLSASASSPSSSPSVKDLVNAIIRTSQAVSPLVHEQEHLSKQLADRRLAQQHDQIQARLTTVEEQLVARESDVLQLQQQLQERRTNDADVTQALLVVGLVVVIIAGVAIKLSSR